MPILTKEQGTVDVSPSSGQLSPIDTFSRPAENNSAALDAERLSRSLASFANMMEPIEAQDRAIKEKTKENKFESWVSSVEQDMAGGLSAMAATKKLYPQESPIMQQRLAQAATINKLERDLYPQWATIFADQATVTDPAKLQAKIDSIKTDYLKNNPGADDFEKAAILRGINEWEGKVKARAIEPQADALYKAGEQRFAGDSNVKLMASQTAVSNASATVGIDPRFTLAIMKSYNPNGDPTARNRYQGQTASGLMDITDGTWNYLVDKYGKQYGVTEDMKNDPRGSALMGAAYAKELYDQITAEKGSAATVGEVNAAYMLGFGGFKKMLSLNGKNPNIKMNEVLDPGTFRVNANFFRRKDGSIMTVGEAMNKWEGAAMSSGALKPARRFDGVAPFSMTKENFASTQGYKWTDFKNDGKYGGDAVLDGRVINLLDTVTSQFGRGKLPLTSAFRSKKYNDEHAESNDSQHTHGTALDIDVKGYSEADKKRLISLFVANGARGVGYYADGTIHVDLRSGSGKQPDGMAVWNTGPRQEWFHAGLEEGRKMRGEGMVPASGFNGQPLNGFDMRVAEGQANGLTAQAARDVLFTTMLTQAEAMRDVSILDAIPDGSITADQQAKKMEMMRSIPNLLRQEQEIKERTSERNKKNAYEAMESQITEAVRNGQVVDIDKVSTFSYTDADGNQVTVSDPRLRATAIELNSQDRVDEPTSIAYVADLGDKLQSMFITGDPGDLFKNNPNIQSIIDNNGGKVPDIGTLRNAILFDTNMNVKQRTDLAANLGKIAETYNLVNDPVFVDYSKNVSTVVDNYLKVDSVAKFSAETRPEVQQLFNELPNQVEMTMKKTYLAKVRAWQEDNPGKQFYGEAKLKAVEESEAKALTRFKELREEMEKLAATKPPSSGKADTQTGSPFKIGDTIPGLGQVKAATAKGVMVIPSGGGNPVIVPADKIPKQGPAAPSININVPPTLVEDASKAIEQIFQNN